MKKLMILSAAALAIFLSMPQLADATTVQNEITITQDQAVKYTEVPATTLPEIITATLAKDFAGYAIDKAYLGDNGTFKVEISKEAVKNVVFFSSTGEVIKAEK